MTIKTLKFFIFKTLTTALVLIMFAGCSTVGGNRRKDKNRSVIKDISFKGNKLFSSRELKSYLLIKEKDVIDEQSVGSAFEIIIELYKSKGFFLAEIKRIDIKKDRKKRLKITVVIDENTPAIVTKINFNWNHKIQNYKNIEELIDIKVGKPAAAEKLNSSVDTLYEELYNQAYPLAVVNEEIIVKKDFKSAEAFFNIDPGPQSNIGKLTISGLEQIKYKPVYREIEDFEGKPFNAKNKKAIRQALSDMNLFTSVSIVTKKAVDKNNNLDATIYVTEADFKNLRLGVGLKFEQDKFLVWTSAVYSDSNLFKKLNHFQLTAMAGWALLPVPWNLEAQGPVVLLEPSITKKGFLEKKLVWNLKLAGRVDIETDYQYFKPSITPSVSRLFYDRILIKLGYSFDYVIMWSLTDEVLAELKRIYSDLVNPMRLGELQISTRFMFTDTIIEPNNGAVLKFTYSVAANWLGSQVDYNKYEPSISLYWRIFKRLQLAINAETGLIFPFNGTDFVGLQNTFYLGGANTVRGWRGKKLSPYETICLSNGNCKIVHIGGNTLVLGNVELRIKTSKIITMVTFLDVGDVQKGVMVIIPSQWNYSTGLGVRLDTPIGLFRVDAGIRINNPEVYNMEPRWGLHIGLGNVF